MISAMDPFARHPELRDKIRDPLQSFFRTFRAEEFFDAKPELQWVRALLHSDEEREQSRLSALADHRDSDLWVFAYGSLMWDPAFHFSEVRRAHVADHSRKFILKDIYGARGTRETPGLMAALDKGRGCDGLLFRISRQEIDTETEILWRREMVGPGYIPTTVTARADDQPIEALTFVANSEAEAICTEMTRAEQIEFIATGTGFLGTSLEYLENIIKQFSVLGIVDQDCSSLLDEVERHVRSRAADKDRTHSPSVT